MKFGHIFLSLVVITLITSTLGFVQLKAQNHQYNSEIELNAEVPAITILSETDLASAGFPGTGTEGDPYIIGNNEINAISTQIEIRNTVSYIVITDNILNNTSPSNGIGIEISNSSNIIIKNNIIRNNYYGMLINSGSNLTLQNNILQDNSEGIYMYGRDSILQNNTVSGSIWGIGALGINNTFSYNNLTQNAIGLYSYGNKDDQIYNNTLTDNTHGIYISNGDNIHFYNNTIYDNVEDGIETQTSIMREKQIYVYNNNITANGKNGIEVFNSRNMYFYNNTVYNNNETGINLQAIRDFAHVQSVEVFQNQIYGNQEYGVTLGYTRFSKVYGNNISSNGLQGIAYLTDFSIAELNYLSLNNIIDNNPGGNQSIINEKMTVLQNYWGDLGYGDSNGDGIFDSPFSENGNIVDEEPLVSEITTNSARIGPVYLTSDSYKVKSFDSIEWDVISLKLDISFNLYLENSTDTYTIAENLTEKIYSLNTFDYDDGSYNLIIETQVTTGNDLNSTFDYFIWNRYVIAGVITNPTENDVITTQNYTVMWDPGFDSEDPNAELKYDLYYAIADYFDTVWTLIETNITTTSYNWNVSSIPDSNEYIMKIVAKNSFGDTGTWEMPSYDPFEIDNDPVEEDPEDPPSDDPTDPPSDDDPVDPPSDDEPANSTGPAETDDSLLGYSEYSVILFFTSFSLIAVFRKRENTAQ